MRRRGVILWDFDGTLAYREGMWAGALLDVLDERAPGHGITRDELRPFLNAGFPWHEPERPHLDLAEPGAWWASLERVLARAYESAGLAKAEAAELARHVRARYVDPGRWRAYDDAAPTLHRLRDLGWRQAILSNHVPELPTLVEALGLAGTIERVICSAATGYEKPHAEAYRAALAVTDDPEVAWMVGDSVVADVLGAEREGLRAILVRKRDERARLCSPDLAGVVEIVEEA